MIAMQYSFTLPGDYDMSIVDRRISEKGHLIDEFPHLKFKAYLHSKRSGVTPASENLYGSFYVWDRIDGLNDFLSGPGFVGLTQSFGWPSVKLWSVWNCAVSPEVKSAVFATRDIVVTSPYADLAALRRDEAADAEQDVVKRGALASLSAFEPTTWSRVRFRLWRERIAPPTNSTGYDVGYMSVTGQN
jgi:hypothetical protein